MKTATAIYTCTKCDAQSPKWTGQCLECGAWGTVAAQGQKGQEGQKGQKAYSKATPAKIMSFTDINGEGSKRTAFGVGEIDRTFGGGVVPGSVTLIGGEPGIGKSTICLLLAAKMAANGRTVYVSGEESPAQVKARAERIDALDKDMFFLGETEVETVIATLHREKPALAVIDSIQMMHSADIPSETGAVNQLRGVTAKLVGYAKSSGTPLLLVGHVTKDGNVAGPKTLEHLVDAVLSFEGERAGALRFLRVLKNRFGSTDETGIFEMTQEGLKEIRNPSAYLLDERHNDISGDVVSCIMEGTRPVLVNIQALVRKTSFGYPTRRASGIEQSRLEMLIAVLGARGGMDLGEHDVFINVVGGLKLKDPTTDLAVATALASAFNDTVVRDTAIWGEIGLGGEVRPVSATDRRLSEASQLGFRRVIAPLPRKKTSMKLSSNIEVVDVHTVKEALRTLAE
ncbi:MAG: DNA repair protein RadA [Patescibacteria group bacterium]|nr:DNA repair protein RadA [Patescibacteria group bacterium]